MKKSFYVFFIVLLACGDILDPRLKIVNKTSYDICMDFKFYPTDTLFDNFQVYIESNINGNDSVTVKKYGENSWTKELKESGQLSLYFYYTDSLKKDKFKYRSMYQYYLDRKYFKCITLNERQLDRCNWIVTVNDTLP